MTETISIKDITHEELKQLWLSDQLTYQQYMAEVKRRAEMRKSND
jgi:hypothetical protein